MEIDIGLLSGGFGLVCAAIALGLLREWWQAPEKIRKAERSVAYALAENEKRQASEAYSELCKKFFHIKVLTLLFALMGCLFLWMYLNVDSNLTITL